jgi:predicted outer membrane lipoprotein
MNTTTWILGLAILCIAFVVILYIWRERREARMIKLRQTEEAERLRRRAEVAAKLRALKKHYRDR